MQNQVLSNHAFSGNWSGMEAFANGEFFRDAKFKGKYDKLLSPQFLVVGNTFNVEKHETDNKSP